MGGEHVPAANRRRHRVVATSLLVANVTDADHIAEALKEEGWPNANRSLVIREALGRLAEDLRGKTSEEIFRYFLDRRARRIPCRSASGVV
jgi:hypothetical protein